MDIKEKYRNQRRDLTEYYEKSSTSFFLSLRLLDYANNLLDYELGKYFGHITFNFTVRYRNPLEFIVK